MAGMDVTADHLALRRDVGGVEVPRDFVRASGPDAITFLQGQLSQDIAVLPVGASAWSLLLQPQGKLDAWLRVSRLGDDEVVLDVDGGWGEAVVTRLQRFKLRTRCELEPLVDWRCVALRGPRSTAALGRAGEVEGGDDAGRAGAAGASGAIVVADAGWPGLPGVDLLGPGVTLPDGVRSCGIVAYHNVRIESGVPLMGAELGTGTIPAEAGIVEASVSFTKGCYTGQELVARIDSRGSNVPRRLAGVVIGTDVVPPEGATLHVADVVVEAGEVGGAGGAGAAEVGRLTSVGESLDLRAPIALAYVRRAVTPPAEVVVRWPGGQAPARVLPLPLVSSEP
jgi:folate-binding protein YgfZ